MKIRKLALVPVLLSVLVVAACGSAKTEKVSGSAPVAATSSPTTTPQPVAVPTRPKKRRHRHRVVLTACDGNIQVKAATTTCGFAQNVFYEYWKAAQSGQASSIDAYSPASGRTYTLTCARRTSITCRADDGGYVTFAASAIDAYDADQAASYACSGKLGPAEADACAEPNTPTVTDVNPPSEPPGDCDPNYEGACLDPNSPDYDCDGGSGDGPDYTGEVKVVGDDHYGLDRDGDGTACDDSGGSYSDPSSDYSSATPDDPSSDSPGTSTTEDFGSGSGSVGACVDGTLSDSIGRPGACSHHGGVG
jgi:hypothetical protein